MQPIYVSVESSLRTWNKLYFHSAIYSTVINAPIYTSKLNLSNWQVCNGLCLAFSYWKTKKLRRFDNTIAHWSMPVRQFLRNLQTHRAFIAAFTSEKQWMTIKKSVFCH
jgi:hypothetical protein